LFATTAILARPHVTQDALSLLEPLTQDTSPVVRQGAFIAQALVMLQQPNTHPKIDATRKLFQKVIADKHEDVSAKFGAIYAQGILEAGALLSWLVCGCFIFHCLEWVYLLLPLPPHPCSQAAGTPPSLWLVTTATWT
jgi:hypothetical protein